MIERRANAAIDASGPRHGPGLVLVHGSVVSRKMWLPQLTGLADLYRVIAPDLPGHGELAADEFTFDAAIEVLSDAIDGEAGGRAVVVGLSLGGWVAIELAHRHPERVAALVLCGSSRSFTGAAGIYLRAVSELMRRGWLQQTQDQAERKTKKLYSPELAAAAEEQLRAGLQTRPLANAFSAMAGRDWLALLAEFPGPTLILNGERDSMARTHEERFAAAARQGRVEILEGAGHACNLDRPAAFDRAVLEFVRDVEPPWSTAAVSR